MADEAPIVETPAPSDPPEIEAKPDPAPADLPAPTANAPAPAVPAAPAADVVTGDVVDDVAAPQSIARRLAGVLVLAAFIGGAVAIAANQARKGRPQ
jgi:hypothetical protein